MKDNRPLFMQVGSIAETGEWVKVLLTPLHCWSNGAEDWNLERHVFTLVSSRSQLYGTYCLLSLPVHLPRPSDAAHALLPGWSLSRCAPMRYLPAHIIPINVVEDYEFVRWHLTRHLQKLRGGDLKGYYLSFTGILRAYLGFNGNVAILGVRRERGPIR